MKIPRNRQKINIDVESLPTIINMNNVPSPGPSSSPEDSGIERSTGSANSEDINMRRSFCKDDLHSHHGKDNGIYTVANVPGATQQYDECYFDLVKKTILLERQTPL